MTENMRRCNDSKLVLVGSLMECDTICLQLRDSPSVERCIIDFDSQFFYKL